VIAINKMEVEEWSEERFHHCCQQIGHILKVTFEIEQETYFKLESVASQLTPNKFYLFLVIKQQTNRTTSQPINQKTNQLLKYKL
jgi:translation elongation factor EF-1alpha